MDKLDKFVVLYSLLMTLSHCDLAEDLWISRQELKEFINEYGVKDD